MSRTSPLVAIAPLGFEQVTAAEIRSLGGGIGKTKIGRGRIDFEGPADAYLRANLHLRTAERILIPVGRFGAQNARDFAQQAAKLPWERWLPHEAVIEPKISVKASRLYHSGAVADALFEALAQRGLGPEAAFGLGDAAARGEKGNSGSEGIRLSVDVRGTGDRWVLSVDTTGPGLNRRGYRKQPGPAPLRETQAAGLLQAVGWGGDRAFLDPMCGAGTLPIEAAWIASQRAPGLERSYAFAHFPAHDSARWEELLASAREAAKGTGPPIVGADSAASAVRAARANAKQAKVLDQVRWFQRGLGETPIESGGTPGLVLMNPPYGRRLSARGRGHQRGASEAELWASWGETLRERLPGWALAVISPRKDLALAFGGGGRSRLRFQNGGITVHLWVWRGA